MAEQGNDEVAGYGTRSCPAEAEQVAGERLTWHEHHVVGEDVARAQDRCQDHQRDKNHHRGGRDSVPSRLHKVITVVKGW